MKEYSGHRLDFDEPDDCVKMAFLEIPKLLLVFNSDRVALDIVIKCEEAV